MNESIALTKDANRTFGYRVKRKVGYSLEEDDSDSLEIPDPKRINISDSDVDNGMDVEHDK